MAEPESDPDDAAGGSADEPLDEAEEARLRDRLGFPAVSHDREERRSELHGAEPLPPRPRRFRIARTAAVEDAVPAEVVDDIGVRLDELRSAVEAVATRIG